MKHKISLLVSLVLSSCLLIGCTKTETVTVDKRDKSIITIDNNIKEGEYLELDEFEWEEYNDSHLGFVSEDKFIYVKRIENLSNSDNIDIVVNVPFEVYATNGVIENSHRVRFTTESILSAKEKDSDYFVAYILSARNLVNAKDKKEVELKGYIVSDTQDNAFTLETDKIYNDSLFMYVDSKDSFPISVKETYDGKTTEYYPFSDMIPTDVTDGRGHTLKSDGKHMVNIKLSNGQEEERTFYIDTKKPSIAKKNGKLVVKDKKKDNYASGIKYIKVNGKEIKNNSSIKKLKKRFKNKLVSIEVSDNAGNKAFFIL